MENISQEINISWIPEIGIQFSRKNVKNLKYGDDTSIMVGNEEALRASCWTWIK